MQHAKSCYRHRENQIWLLPWIPSFQVYDTLSAMPILKTQRNKLAFCSHALFPNKSKESKRHSFAQFIFCGKNSLLQNKLPKSKDSIMEHVGRIHINGFSKSETKIGLNFFFFFFFFCCLVLTGGYLLYNVVLVSATQQYESAIDVHMSLPS